MDAIRVLIAEDNAAYRQSLYQMLQAEEGIKVLEPACDGHEAVEKCQRFRPDVVLMDIDMPGRDGLSAARLIRETQPRIGVIILTLHDSGAFRAWAQRVSASAFLSKDADPEKIIQAIRQVCDRRPAA